MSIATDLKPRTIPVNRLKVVLEERGITAYRLAQMTGISCHTLYKAASNPYHLLKTSTIVAIMQTLDGVTASDLIALIPIDKVGEIEPQEIFPEE